MIPSRFTNLEEARARFGDRVDRLAPFLMKGDPLADAVVEEMERSHEGRGFAMFCDALSRPDTKDLALPPAMRAFFAEVERVPVWVDWATMKRGGELLIRSGALGGLVLGTASLIYGYASPAGNKPLVFSGRLVERAPRRLAETARFVQATALDGGLKRTGSAYAITLKVRIMHAKVRAMLRRSPKWRTEAWGEPVNQHDMAATTLLFSLVFLKGIRELGIDVDRDESESFMHLWRYSGHLMGVDTELLPTSEFDAWSLGYLINATQGKPDQDSRALVDALLGAFEHEAMTLAEKRLGRIRAGMAQATSRFLLGDDLAEDLGLDRTPFIAGVHALRAVTIVAEQARRRSPEAHRKALLRGARYWREVVEKTLAGESAKFVPPERLADAA